MLYVNHLHPGHQTGKPVWIGLNGDGGWSVLTRDFPAAVGCWEIPDTPESRAAGYHWESPAEFIGARETRLA